MKLQKLLLSLGLLTTPLLAKDYPITGQGKATIDVKKEIVATETASSTPGAPTQDSAISTVKSTETSTAERKKNDIIETADSKSATSSEVNATPTVGGATTTENVTATTLTKDVPATGATSKTEDSPKTETTDKTKAASDDKAKDSAAKKADDDVQAALAKIRGGSKTTDAAKSDEEDDEDKYGARKRYETFRANNLNPSRNISDKPGNRSFGVK